MRVSTVADIDQWPAGGWPGFTDVNYYSSPAWLRCAKAATGGEVGAVVVRDGDHLIAVAPFWLTTGNENSARRPAEVLSDVGLSGDRFLVAGTSTAYLSQLVAIDDEHRAAAAVLVVDELRALASEHRVDGVLALYADEPSTAAYLAATPGRTAVLLDAEAVIPVPATFRDYPAGMSGHRRRKVHKEWRLFNEAGYDLSIEHLSGCLDEFVPLSANLERKHGNEIDEALWHHTLSTQAALCGADDLVFCARRHGRLIAASLCYQAGGRLTVRCFGQDYERAETRYDYFALVYYLPMRHAIESRLHQVSVGISTLGAKVRRGARLHRLWAVDLAEKPLWTVEDADRVNRTVVTTMNGEVLP